MVRVDGPCFPFFSRPEHRFLPAVGSALQKGTAASGSRGAGAKCGQADLIRVTGDLSAPAQMCLQVKGDSRSITFSFQIDLGVGREHFQALCSV